MSDTPPEAPVAAKHVGDVIKDVLTEHAPKAAEAGAKAHAKERESFLEETEQYNAKMLGPLITVLRSSGKLPAEIDGLLAEIQKPGFQISGILSSFFLYGVVFQIAANVLGPFFQSVANTVWADHPDRPLSPADLANLVVQGYLDQATGEQQAGESGINTENFDLLVKVTGMPPGPQDLLQMFRREIIPMGTGPGDFPSVHAGLAEGHTKDAWIPYYERLAYVWPSPIDFINAAIREQFPSKEAAFAWAAKAGLDTTTQTEIGSFADVLYDIGGRPPGPVEAAHMAHRGIIPWQGSGPTVTSFQQAIAESDLKTKWTDSLQALSTYVLTNGEITSLVRHGFIAASDAYPYYAKNGVDGPTAALMIESALVDQLAEDRQLTKGEIGGLYKAGLLTETEATDALAVIGFHGSVGTELVNLWDFQREAAQFQRIIQIIGRQVVLGKITAPNAKATLEQMGVPDATITILLNDWALAQQVEVPSVTAAQIVSAVFYGVETPLEGILDLEALGYTEYDAWRLLSIRLHGPVNLPGGNPQRPTTTAVL